MNRNATPIRIAAAVIALTLLAAGCGSDGSDATNDSDTSSDITTADTAVDDAAPAVGISDPWSRKPAEGQTATAVYGVVSNPTDADIQVTAVSTDVTETAELHQTLTDDEGVMSMQEVPEGFTVPAGGEFTFEPGGPHMMLLGIDPATYPAEVELTLSFDGADPLTFTAEVREAEMDTDDMGAEGGDMDDMEEGDMEMEGSEG